LKSANRVFLAKTALKEGPTSGYTMYCFQKPRKKSVKQQI